MRRLSARFTRWLFYAALAAGALFLCVTATLTSFASAGEATGFNPVWLAGLCCVGPLVLAGVALANESR